MFTDDSLTIFPEMPAPKYKQLIRSLRLASDFIQLTEAANSVLDQVRSSDSIRRQELNNSLAATMIDQLSQAILAYIRYDGVLQSNHSLNMDEVIKYAGEDIEEEDDDDEPDADSYIRR